MKDWKEQALQGVKDYLNQKPYLKDDLIKSLKINIDGLKAEIEDVDFDWNKEPQNKEVVNEVLGGLLMDYTTKASWEEIIELDEFIVNSLEGGK